MPSKGEVMDTLKKLTLRMPIELHARLERWAKQERRSLHAQIIKVLEDAMEEVEQDAGTSIPPRSE
jgi:predicted HicB family RNase H-like nuclease